MAGYQTGRLIEVYASVQGEGLWVGKPQVFVRLHGCRLTCNYCDTPKTHLNIRESRYEIEPFSERFVPHSLEWSISELKEVVCGYRIPSLALTGGEPLEQVGFLEQWLEGFDTGIEILLETNGIEVEAYTRIADYITLTSFDLKLPSNTGESPYWDGHRRFIEAVGARQAYAKVVFNQHMTNEEMAELSAILEANPKLMLFFQPETPLRLLDRFEALKKFQIMAMRYPQQLRLVPQVHKQLGVL